MASHVDILILGAGWTSTFLIPLLDSRGITHAATTRAGSATTLPFTFDPTSSDPTPYRLLPPATTVLVTFPITVMGGSKCLVDLYTSTHPSSTPAHFLQLGTTGIWNLPADGTTTRHSPFDNTHPRAISENELLALNGSVLNLSGLWGGESRNPKSWLPRVAPTKEKLREKGSLHLIHGEDVAAAIVAMHEGWEKKAQGERWMLTDLRSYDWWDLALAWGREEWVLGFLEEEGGAVLPRRGGRKLDSSEFWRVFGVLPGRCLLI